MLGNIASILMALVFFPIFASDEVNYYSLKTTKTLLKICQYLQNHNSNFEVFFELETQLRGEFKDMSVLINEAEHEHPFSNHDYSAYRELIQLGKQMAYLFHNVLITKEYHGDLKIIETRLQNAHSSAKCNFKKEIKIR